MTEKDTKKPKATRKPKTQKDKAASKPKSSKKKDNEPKTIYKATKR